MACSLKAPSQENNAIWYLKFLLACNLRAFTKYVYHHVHSPCTFEKTYAGSYILPFTILKYIHGKKINYFRWFNNHFYLLLLCFLIFISTFHSGKFTCRLPSTCKWELYSSVFLDMIIASFKDTRRSLYAIISNDKFHSNMWHSNIKIGWIVFPELISKLTNLVFPSY